MKLQMRLSRSLPLWTCILLTQPVIGSPTEAPRGKSSLLIVGKPIGDFGVEKTSFPSKPSSADQVSRKVENVDFLSTQDYLLWINKITKRAQEEFDARPAVEKRGFYGSYICGIAR